MLKKLGKSITIANAVAFAVVILVGGVSIFLTWDILQNHNKIESLSRDIVTIDSIHSNTYQLILSMHHYIIDPDEVYSREVQELTDNLEEKVKLYIEHEMEEDEMEEDEDDDNSELVYLQRILNNIQEFKSISMLLNTYVNTGQLDRDELMAYETYGYDIEEISSKINQLHFNKIDKQIHESLTNMWIILFIYLLFISIGGLAIYGGHRVLLKKVVRPIKELAAATIEFAEGRLDKRVNTDSESEIGQLYNSFNQMAEKLQDNDEILRKFNEALERKVRERTSELQYANDQLQRTQIALIRTEKVAAVGQIAAGVTHEIKNPLNSLSISSQMLLKELALKFGEASSSYESAALIKHEINRINNILENFVNFAKFPEPQFYTNNINTVISEVADLMSSVAQEKDILLKLSLQDDIPEFSFDARQFKEVLINLIQNAIKSIPHGGEIEIKTATAAENVIIHVKDTGEGIPEKYIDKIFTPFFSTKEEGLGLGLPIVQRIIESHSGKIECTSTVGEGTVFKISLPIEIL